MLVQLMQLRRNAHHAFRLMYWGRYTARFVWIPKYRHKVFSEPYATTLKSMLHKIGYDYNLPVSELEIPVDHIQPPVTAVMMVESEPKMAPSRIMQIFKSISARQFFATYPEIKQKYFWGGKLWTSSYYVETVGQYSESAVREYVRNQIQKMDASEQVARQLGLFDP